MVHTEDVERGVQHDLCPGGPVPGSSGVGPKSPEPQDVGLLLSLWRQRAILPAFFQVSGKVIVGQGPGRAAPASESRAPGPPSTQGKPRLLKVSFLRLDAVVGGGQHWRTSDPDVSVAVTTTGGPEASLKISIKMCLFLQSPSSFFFFFRAQL